MQLQSKVTERMLQTSSITDHLYGAYDHHGQDSSVGKKAEEQQQRNSDIPRLPSQPVKESSYGVFLQVLAKMADREKQFIRFGELPILSEQILNKTPKLKMGRVSPDDILAMIYTKEEILEVAATLYQFYKAWLETAPRIIFAGSDAMLRAHGLPHMAKIWVILHEMGMDHLLDSFCASRITDESLPLDILTLESILPLDEKKYPSDFAVRQFKLEPRSKKLASLQDIQCSAPLGEPYLGPPEAPRVFHNLLI